tara:strand:+ start:46333 stop:46707 length:375 start_codon:yes stop_codon:yes gene_type:complete
MSDLKIDYRTGDLVIEDNKLLLVGVPREDGEIIAQRISIRLQLYFREWVLDREAGTKWYEKILKKGADKYVVDQELRQRVLNTKGVSSIREWNSNLDAQARTYSVQFIAITRLEEIPINFNINV